MFYYHVPKIFKYMVYSPKSRELCLNVSLSNMKVPWWPWSVLGGHQRMLSAQQALIYEHQVKKFNSKIIINLFKKNMQHDFYNMSTIFL